VLSVDLYLSRRFDRVSYNCLDLAREVWLGETGEDLGERLRGLFVPVAERKIEARHFRAFERLAAPVSPCLVLMRRPKAEPHMGVFLRGRVIHAQERGVEWMPIELAAFGFSTVEYFR
jgi:hypothetical protein